MRKQLGKIKHNTLFGILIGILLCSGIVYGVNTYQSNAIEYSPTDSSWNVSNVNEAINDLYSNQKNENRPVYLSYDYNSTSSTKRSIFVNKGELIWYFTNATGCTTTGVDVSNYSSRNYIVLLAKESGLLTITLNAETSSWNGGILRSNITNSFSNLSFEYSSTSTTTRKVNVNKDDIIWYRTNATGCTTSGVEVDNYSRDSTIILHAKGSGMLTITLNAETSGWIGGILKASN